MADVVPLEPKAALDPAPTADGDAAQHTEVRGITTDDPSVGSPAPEVRTESNESIAGDNDSDLSGDHAAATSSPAVTAAANATAMGAPSTWFPQVAIAPAAAAKSIIGRALASSDPNQISDRQFQKALNRLVDLAVFANQRPQPLNGLAAIAARLGPLNTLKFASTGRGREATESEWIAVEERTQEIWKELSEVERRKFNSTQVPGWFSYLVSSLLAAVIGSVGVAYWGLPGSPVTPMLLWAFLGFVIASGSMGAAASIGMNALSVQDDATFDLSVGKFLWLRVALGALFGTLLTIPWAFPVFQEFVTALGKSTSSGGVDVTPEQLKQAAYLLAPFILGFSTSLVILVLTRFVEAVQTIFGKSSSK